MGERDILTAQLVRRGDELEQVYEKIKINRTKLKQGEKEYERLHSVETKYRFSITDLYDRHAATWVWLFFVVFAAAEPSVRHLFLHGFTHCVLSLLAFLFSSWQISAGAIAYFFFHNIFFFISQYVMTSKYLF